ncbi:MAG: hypothetical protein PVI83_01125 [Lysobacterales bacterium]|jgi:hypothetical protein
MKRTSCAAVLAALMLSIPAAGLAQPYKMQPEKKAPEKKAPTESVAELEKKAIQAYEDGNWVRFYAANSNLHAQRPFTPDYMINIVLSAASLERRTTAYHYMLQLQKQGYSVDFNRFEQTGPVRGTEAYDYINDLLVKAGDPLGEGTTLFTLEDVRPSDLGDVAWDSTRERFLVGTRAAGRLLAVDDEGSAELLLEANEENGLWSIDGIAVDPARNRLWIASSASPAFSDYSPADAHRGALFGFELDSLELAERFNLPADPYQHELGAVAVGGAGEVYVIDRATPIIYRKTADSDRLEAFAGGPQFVALTDIAVTPDNSRVFVSDAVLGILVVDPTAKRSAMISGPDTLNLYGIYGLQFSAGSLVVTQSGFSPQRIVRLELNADGATVGNIVPMASALESFDMPGVGTLRGDKLYYFANHGSSSEEGGVRMMATPLDSGQAVTPPDMRQFEEILKQATKKAAGQ